MLQRPRRQKFLKFFNYKKTHYLPITLNTLPCLIPKRPVKLKWLHFETLRIKIARVLAKQRRGGKKVLFKHKTVTKTYKTKYQLSPTLQVSRPQIKYYGFPSTPIHNKTQGSRMGKGKGGSLLWYHHAKPGIPLISIKIKNRYLLAQFRRKLQCLVPAHFKIYSEFLTGTTLFLYYIPYKTPQTYKQYY